MAEELLLRKKPELPRKAPVLPDALLEDRAAEGAEIGRCVDHPYGELPADGLQEPLRSLAGRNAVLKDRAEDGLHVKLPELLPRPAPVRPVAGLPRIAEPPLHR